MTLGSWRARKGWTKAICMFCGLDKWIKDGDGGACPSCAAKR